MVCCLHHYPYLDLEELRRLSLLLLRALVEAATAAWTARRRRGARAVRTRPPDSVLARERGPPRAG
jgi:hypothetical protein